MRWQAMNHAMAMDVEPLTCIVTVMMLLVRVLFRLDREVDFTYPSLQVI